MVCHGVKWEKCKAEVFSCGLRLLDPCLSVCLMSLLCLMVERALILSFLCRSCLSLRHRQVWRGLLFLVHSPREYLWRLVSGLEKGSVYFSPEGDAGGWPAVKTSLMWCPYFPPLIISSHSFLNIFYAPFYPTHHYIIFLFPAQSSFVWFFYPCSLLFLPAFVPSFISSWCIPLRCAVFAPPPCRGLSTVWIWAHEYLKIPFSAAFLWGMIGMCAVQIADPQQC